LDPPNLLTDLHIPPLARDIENRPLILTVLQYEPSRILVEVFTTAAPIMDEEIVYTAFVLQAIRSSTHQMTVNGDSDHIVLRMAGTGD
jgi:hypothetical protein